ncbi:MAG: hypothetical protein IKC37_00585 [Clostridia bacterium]|nr:hypothetical protein [Clostridia bacterium]
MLLSTFLGKNVYAKGAYKGTCDGVLLAKKSRAVRYLSCNNGRAHYYIAFSSVDYATDVIRLKNFHQVTPKGCETFVVGLPVYDDEGRKIGAAQDMDTENLVAVELILQDDRRIPVSLMGPCHDAILIKKAPPFPLSLRIPSHAKKWLHEGEAKEKFVTRRTLSSAAKKGNLIKFTLALLPALDGVFCGQL